LLALSELSENGLNDGLVEHICKKIDDLGKRLTRKFRFFVVAEGRAGYGRIEVAQLDDGSKDIVITLPIFFVRLANERYDLNLADNIPPGLVD
jgi:hypothetical protein